MTETKENPIAILFFSLIKLINWKSVITPKVA